MELSVNAVNFNIDQKLVNFIKTKANKLDLFYDKIINGEVFLKLSPDTSSNNKIAEVKILLPGKSIFVKKESKSFEQATDEAVSSLERQIKKYKQKQG